MINSSRVRIALESVGHFFSGPGGADNPKMIEPNILLFEMITEGAVYSPAGNDLHGVGAVFAHRPGEFTVHRSPGGEHYTCLTAQFRLNRLALRFVWPRVFQWAVPGDAIRFSEEVLFAFHHTDLDRQVLGDLIWSQFRFRLEEFLRTAKNQAIPPLLANVIGHMDRHYAEPLGVDDLAAHFGLSASHLHALFRKHVGMTPHQHLILYRMRFARHMLVTTTAPIKSIARDVGYSNTENFCRAFKKCCGLTAAAYRRKFIPYG